MTRARAARVTPIVEQISNNPAGICPHDGCDQLAYEHTVDGVDGSFRACPDHCGSVALDALWASQDADEDPEGTLPFVRCPSV